MEESILTSIKKLLGIVSEITEFDMDIIIHINTTLNILNQIGVGVDGFEITGADESWSDFIENSLQFNSVKSYVYLKVKLLFDPPSNSSLIESTNRLLSELEWRLSITKKGDA